MQINGKLKYPVTDFRLNDEKINYDPDTLAFSYVMKNVDNGKHALKIYAQDNRLNDGRPVMNYSYPIVIDSTLPSLILPNLTVDSQGNYFAYTLSLIHISEPTRRTPISYAVFCLKKNKITLTQTFDTTKHQAEQIDRRTETGSYSNL